MDLRILADGSGGTNADSASWCAIVYIGTNCYRVVGYRSFGSNNYAELKSCLDGLFLLESKLNPEFLATKPTVTITSDSELTVRCASGVYQRKANLALWRMVDYYAEIFDLVWKHVPRNTTPENAYCDKLSLPFRRQGADPFLEKFPPFTPSQA